MSRDDIDEPRHPLAGSPTRFAATLIAALVGTSPAFGAAIDGEMTLPEALVRFLVAFGVFWILGTVVGFAFHRNDADDLADPNPSDMPPMVPGSAAADR